MQSDEYKVMAAAEDHMWWFRGLHEWMLDRIGEIELARNAKVLDCGAGTGGFAKKLSGRFPDLDLIAIDIDADAVRHFSTKSKKPIARGSVNSLPFGDHSFDVIVGSDILYHAAVDEPRAIAELFRCLKPGGHLLLNLPAYNWMRSSHDDRVHTARRYTAGGAADRLRAAGFDIREATYRNSLLFLIMALFRLTVGRFTTKSDVEEFPAWQEALFGKTIAFENYIARRGVRFPFGGSVYVRAVKS
jgi:SAM-dependent methyltransferase